MGELFKKAKMQLAMKGSIEKIRVLNDVTKHILEHGNKRLIIVVFTPNKYKFATKKCLAFLVDDIDNAECPGYPACGVEYFDSFEEGKARIEKLYKEIKYTPRYSIDRYVSKDDLRK